MPVKNEDADRIPHQEVEVIINGGPVNVWHRWGLKSNPFPAVPKAEFGRFNQVLRNLDSDPINSREELLKILEGGAPWFIERCVEAYRPGKRTRFKFRVLTEGM